MKLKSIVIRVKEIWYDKYQVWDSDRRFPKTKNSWCERIPIGYWNAYDETYGAEDSFATDVGAPVYEYGKDAVAIIGDDSALDRLAYAINSEKQAGLPRETVRATTDLLRVAMGKIANAGDGVTVKFKDVGDPNHVTEVTFSGSADFYDFDDKTKLAFGEKWYRRWYDENRKRGLVDFEYSFPAEKPKEEFASDQTVTNKDAYANTQLMDTLKAWAAADGDRSFDDWLAMPAIGEARSAPSGLPGKTP